jgi:hypothetical protein
VSEDEEGLVGIEDELDGPARGGGGPLGGVDRLGPSPGRTGALPAR